MRLMTPISEFVLKVHSRCDLACDHCYVYEHSDQSWRTKPLSVDPAVVRQAAVRIAEHAAEHGLEVVQVILHGGEPLLLGPRRLSEVFEALYTEIGPVTQADLHVHTNGVLLSEELCDVFARYRVKVGISLDGDRAANDRHRTFADGRSSHGRVLKALELLRRPEYRHLYAGILCTVDVANDPAAVLDALLAEKPPYIDFLLPHATWDHPPPRPPGETTAYAAWLNTVFDRWVGLGRPVPVRLFESIEASAVGEPSGYEGIGLDPVDLLVIETDGDWEQVDSLKTAYDGAPRLLGRAADAALNVFEHSVDAAAAHPAVAGRQAGIANLGDTCRACPLVERCGGGHYAHRYRTGTGFRNPSVYCDDLKSLITHIGAPERASADAASIGSRVPAYPSFDLTDIAAIGDGPVDSARALRLASTQLLITRAHLARIGERVAQQSTPDDTAAADGWDLLCTLDREAPEAVRTVLEHPFTHAWSKGCWGRIRLGGPVSVADGVRLSALALAAAIRSGADAALEVPDVARSIHLPTLGTLVRADPGLVVAVTAGRIDESKTDIEAWQEANWVGRGEGRLLLEDLDPYRNTYGYAVAERLSASAVSRWREMLAAAVTLLDQWVPAYAEQVRSCLKAVVPLAPGAADGHRSETSSDAFGAIAAALPGSPEALAMLLVHESQHLLLDTAFATHVLYDASDERRFSVAWREDDRPVDAVLQGAFAHVALAEVWSARKDRAVASEYGAWSQAALSELISHGALSPLGVTFAQSLNGRIQRVLAS